MARPRRWASEGCAASADVTSRARVGLVDADIDTHPDPPHRVRFLQHRPLGRVEGVDGDFPGLDVGGDHLRRRRWCRVGPLRQAVEQGQLGGGLQVDGPVQGAGGVVHGG